MAADGETQTAAELPVGRMPSEAEAVHVARHRRRGLLLLGLAVAGVGFAMALQIGANPNFVAQEMRLSGLQVGLLECIRESCGIAALGVLALLAGLAEPLVGCGMLILLAVGLGAYARVPNYAWLVAMSLVWSQGLHVWMPLPQSMTLALAEPGRSGRRLGQIGAAGAGGSFAGLAVAFILHRWLGTPIRQLYLLAACPALLAAAACLGMPRQIKTPGPRLVFRRRYGLYYLLSFLEGWRKQVFLAFAGFLLVRQHQTGLSVMLGLYMAIQMIGWVATPLVGRLIDRVGERRALVLYYSCMTVFFAGYALIPTREVLWVLYVVDSVFFAFTMALTTYVGRVAPAAEYTPTLSMGVAMNHVAAVVMPLVGGLMWNAVGFRWVFALGAAAAAVSILPASLVPSRGAPAGKQAHAGR